MGRDDVPPPVEPFMSQAYEGGWASHDGVELRSLQVDIELRIGRRGSSSLNGSPSTAFTTPPNDRRISLASIDNLTVGATGSGQSPSPPPKGVVAAHPYAQLAPSPVGASNLPLAVPSSSSQTGSMSEEPSDTSRPAATSFLRHVDGGPAPLPSDAEQQMELPPLYGDVPTSQGRE
ncbi:hypothetical protein JCM24511_03768 [Saitozyma sp. JCM 24511]|nr:hypothetical protein JCM24511_03768 [Saitozyma sp. JCM 24511]